MQIEVSLTYVFLIARFRDFNYKINILKKKIREFLKKKESREKKSKEEKKSRRKRKQRKRERQREEREEERDR